MRKEHHLGDRPAFGRSVRRSEDDAVVRIGWDWFSHFNAVKVKDHIRAPGREGQAKKRRTERQRIPKIDQRHMTARWV